MQYAPRVNRCSKICRKRHWTHPAFRTRLYEHSSQFLPAKTPCLLCVLTFCVLTIVIYSQIRLLNVPLERDEGKKAYMGQLPFEGI